MPSVTVVIPCFNHGRFVGEAVESCLAQEPDHQQTDVRVVVVNDGSDDGSTTDACNRAAQLAPDRVLAIHQPNAGLPAARNAGVAHARERFGEREFLLFLDADDTIEPAFVRTLAEALNHAGNDASHAYCRERLSEKGGDAVWRVPDWDPDLMLITNLHPVTALVRWRCFDEVGGFDESMTDGYEDWEFWIKMIERGWRGVRVPEPLFVWRRHADSTMIHDAVSKHDRLVAQIYERHRALYERRAEALFRLSNRMLREWDLNWLDETLQPHSLMLLWEARDRDAEAQKHLADSARVVQDHIDLLGERDREIRSLHEALAQTHDEREALERRALVRLHRLLGRVRRGVGMGPKTE